MIPVILKIVPDPRVGIDGRGIVCCCGPEFRVRYVVPPGYPAPAQHPPTACVAKCMYSV